VKTPAILTIILASVFSAFADVPTVEGLTSHLFTNAVIIWQAPINDLPQNFWIYQRTLPRIFSETVISNAIVLGSLQSKGFPKPSTNDFYIHEDFVPNRPMPVADFFGIRPDDANLYYTLPDYSTDSKKSAKDIPADKAIVMQAWKYAAQLGLDTNKMVLKNFYTHFCVDENQNAETNAICGRGVFLSRMVDGIPFFTGDEEGDGGEGFSVEFGSNGKIRSFFLWWSDIRRGEKVSTASPQEIIHNIQMHKILVLPDANEEDYFTRLKKLANAKRVVVTKISPFCFEGVFGKVPVYYAPAKLITPVAELDATVDFGNDSTVVHMLTPITR
jgi:hypothetical protein